MKDGSTGPSQRPRAAAPSIIVGDEFADALPADATHTTIGEVRVLRSTRAVTDELPGPAQVQRGNAMQQPLDYRGLRRWTVWVWLIVVLIVSSYLAAIPMLLMLVLTLGVSAGATATIGIAAVGALFIIPVWGIFGGMMGILLSKHRAVRFFKATKLPKDHALTRVTAQLAARLNLPPPEVYVYPDDDINAWATGVSRSNAAVAVSRGALNRLSRDHMHAVIGHELGHIAAADIGRMQFALSFQNASVGYFMFKGLKRAAGHSVGFVGQLGILGMSRRREYWADAIGAVLTSPETMRDALRAVVQDGQRPPRRRKYYNQLMFSWPGSVFLSSHPTLNQRLAALDKGEFYCAVLQMMGRTRVSAQIRGNATSRTPAGIAEWPSTSTQSSFALAMEPVLLLTLVGAGVYYVTEMYSNRAAPVIQVGSDGRGPQVAGWSAETPSEARVRPPTPAKPAEPAEIAALPVYPKEPRYEPDDATGDGELTPYELLVEEGVSCIYRAKINDSYGIDYLEDAGPDKSDLIMYTYPASEHHASLILGLVGSQATMCWKKLGGVQQETKLMKRVQQPYDIWVLTDAKSGATAECGIWPVARNVRNGKGGIAAYCR